MANPEVPEAPPVNLPNIVQVYVCPRCSGYYASGSARPLDEQVNRRTSMRNLADEDSGEWGKITGTRVDCQTCLAKEGVRVQRLLVPYDRPEILIDQINKQVEEEHRKNAQHLRSHSPT